MRFFCFCFKLSFSGWFWKYLCINYQSSWGPNRDFNCSLYSRFSTKVFFPLFSLLMLIPTITPTAFVTLRLKSEWFYFIIFSVLLFYSLRFYLTSFRWRFFTGVWVTASLLKSLWPNWLGLHNTMTASLLKGKTPPTTRVLDMTLKNLMVRF